VGDVAAGATVSLYNMVHGTHPIAPLVLALIDKHAPAKFGRLRDAWVERTEAGSIRLAVYTRNGGGNRECWDGGTIGCECAGCCIEKLLPVHPLYLSDADDDFDCTYATIYFKVPPNAEAILRDLGAPDDFDFTLASFAVEPVDSSKRWNDAIAAMSKAADTKAST